MEHTVRIPGTREALEHLRKVFSWWQRNVLCGSSRRKFFELIVLALSLAGFQVLQSRFMATVITGAAAKNRYAVLAGIACMGAGILVCRLLEWRVQIVREWILGLTWGNLDRSISTHFFAMSLSQHVRFSKRLSADKLLSFRERIMNLQNLVMSEALPAFAAMLLSFTFLVFLSPVAAGIIAVSLIVNAAWMLALNRRVLAVFRPIEEGFRDRRNAMACRWRHVERVQTSAREAEDVQELTAWYDRLIAKDRKFWFFFHDWSAVRSSIGAPTLVAVLAWGAYLVVWTGDWKIGLLYPLWNWSTRIIENLWAIGRLEHQLNWNLPSLLDTIAALEVSPDVLDKQSAASLQKAEPVSIELAGVSYAYKDEAGVPGPLVLRDVSFAIRPGEKVALIGASGSGKTSIMHLLMRSDDPCQGSIRINGTDLRDTELSSWRRKLGYIPQRPKIFPGTVRDNLLYGLSDRERSVVSDDNLRKLMRRLRIDVDLDTMLGDGGSELSGGQAQRLMIGAALAGNPDFMLVDEATSNLDSTTEKEVQQGIAEALSGGVSALIVTHRLSTVRDTCTMFIVVRSAGSLRPGEPQIEAVGRSFEELHRLSPTFRQLASDQDIVIGAEQAAPVPAYA
jgi:ATP-binding cassette, subfamily B, beta-glucan exporter